MGECSLSSDAGQISLHYVRVEHEIQQHLDLKFANRLTANYVFYSRKKINVSLATRLSARVWRHIAFLSNSFINAFSTIEFLRIFDRLFDIMNSRNKFDYGHEALVSLRNEIPGSLFFWKLSNIVYFILKM